MPRKDYSTLNREREPFVIVLEDREIKLPKVLPAKIVLDIMDKDLEDASEEEQTKLGFGLVEVIFGKENWDAVVGEIGITEVPELIQDVLAYYGMGKAAREAREAAEADGSFADEGEDPKAESPSPTLSESGEPSTPTSNGTGRDSETPSTEPPGQSGKEIGRSSSSVSEISPQIPSS